MRSNNYRENQKAGKRTRRPLLAISICCWCLLIAQALWNISLRNDTVLTGFLFFTGVLVTGLYILMLTSGFVTVIYPNDRIEIHFWPFFKETIKMSAVAKMEIMEYSFPGFGVRYDLVNETTYYKASGNTYLRLTLLNNKKIMIGTNDEAELRLFLNIIKSAAPQAVIKSLKTGPQQRSG